MKCKHIHTEYFHFPVSEGGQSVHNKVEKPCDGQIIFSWGDMSESLTFYCGKCGHGIRIGDQAYHDISNKISEYLGSIE